MSKPRIELDKELRSILQKCGFDKTHVYFQPPSNTQIKYPCIVYQLSIEEDVVANNNLYLANRKYDVTVIDKNPDSYIPVELRSHFQKCSMSRVYTADNLNHTAFVLYY